MSNDAFRAITVEDLTMPPGWSVSAGQTFLYTKEEQALPRGVRRQRPRRGRRVSHRRGAGGGRPPGRHRARVISGQKRFITGGGLADYLTLFAITDTGAHPHKGMSELFVAESVWKILMRIGAGSDEIMKFLIARELLKEVGARR